MKSSSELINFELELEEVQPNNTHRNNTFFLEAYEVIEQHLKRKVPQKIVMEKFNLAYGLSIHPARFRQLLEAERIRRNEIRDLVACTLCGQQLPDAIKVEGNLVDTKEHNHVE